MSERRYTDPMRRIVSVHEGAGTDRLTLDCGHEIVRDHRARWGRSTRCFRCRVWNDALAAPAASPQNEGPRQTRDLPRPTNAHGGSAADA